MSAVPVPATPDVQCVSTVNDARDALNSGPPPVPEAFSSGIRYSTTSEPSGSSGAGEYNPRSDQYARAGDPLGSPARQASTGFAALPVSGTQQPEAPVSGRGPFVVVSSPDFIGAARDFYATWTAQEAEGQQRHAKQRSTVFSIMQYRTHPDTGSPLWTREQWDGLISALGAAGVLDRHAAIWHDRDTFSAKEAREQQEKGRDVHAGDLKPLHFHGVVRLKAGVRKQIRFLAERADLPASRIRTPRDSYAEGEVLTGPAAADVAFFDLCQYLVHENKTAVEEGKYKYPRDEVFANFDFSEFLDAGRPTAKGRGKARLSDVDRLAMRIRDEGLTLDEAEAADPLAYNRGETRLKRARAQYLASLPQPQHRMNFYLSGGGGVGKDALARALARSLVPGDWVPGEREPFFVVGEENAEFEGYDGEPVVIIEEATAASLIVQLKGRRNAFKYLNPFPAKSRKNVKGASTLPVNTVTIITGPEPFEKFLEGLAGTYTDRFGIEHHAEDDTQSYRRFPFIIPVRFDEFDIYVNRGFLDDTSSFKEYIAYTGFRQNMRQLLRRVKGVEPVEHRVSTHRMLEAQQVAPIKEQFDRVVAATTSEHEDPDALLAEFADIGTQRSPEERAAAHEQRMVDRLRATPGYDRPEVIEHFRRFHLAGLETPDGSGFIFTQMQDGRPVYWCAQGHEYMELSPVIVTG